MSAPIIGISYTFRSESNPAKTYETLVYVDGTASCECPAWRFKKKVTANGARTCVHLRMIYSGTAEQHAVRFVDYTDKPQTRREPIRTMQQPEIPRRQNRRAFDFSDEE